MTRTIIAYLVTLVAFLACDSVWLTLTGSRLYQPVLGPLLADQPRLVPAALFYLIYMAGLVGFATLAGVQRERWQAATLRGAGFGFCAYATYDLTNQATLKVWSSWLTVADMAWGTILSAFAASAGAAITLAILRRSAR